MERGYLPSRETLFKRCGLDANAVAGLVTPESGKYDFNHAIPVHGKLVWKCASAEALPACSVLETRQGHGPLIYWLQCLWSSYQKPHCLMRTLC